MSEPLNPFSTRFVRPGAIDFHFAGGRSAVDLITALAKQGWRGQIIGPHGSGKSTLLASLAGPLASAGRRTWIYALHDGERRLPASWIADVEDAGANLVVIDGYEQLSYWSRWRLARNCRAREWGLLVTAHQDVGLPTLWTTSPSLELAEEIVARLDPLGQISRQEIALAYAATGGNLREMLFRLYDVVEQQRRTAERA